MAIPEVGDQVMVDFIHDNPDRPFVLGGMFHGKVGGGGGAGNNVKSLSSKSGNKLELNDGEGSVFLTDKGGANMKFDGAGNAIVNANTDHTTSAGQNHTTKAGSKHATTVGKGASELTMDLNGVIDLSGKSKVTIKVGESSITIDSSSITLKSEKIIVKGKNSVDITSAKNHISGESKLDGGDVFIN